MAQFNPTHKERGVKPSPFNGRSEDLPTFVSSAMLYLALNGALYPRDKDKIVLLLGCMSPGLPAMWAHQWIQEHFEDDPFRTLDQFWDDLETTFKEKSHPDMALNKLKNLRQGNTPSDQHNIRFKQLVNEAEINNAGDRTLISFYKDTLNAKIRDAIMSREKIPDKITAWYTATAQEDSNNQQRSQALRRAWTSSRTSPSSYFQPSWNTSRPSPPRRDPNAMDVDDINLPEEILEIVDISKLTPELREQLFQEGRCFYCRRVGHRSNECDKAPRRKQPKKTGFPSKPKKQTKKVYSVEEDSDQEEEPDSEPSINQIASYLNSMDQESFSAIISKIERREQQDF